MTNIPYNDENVAKIREVAEDLRGTSQSLYNVLGRYFDGDVLPEDVDVKLLRELDDIVMECEGCGWWCETSEFADTDEPICEDCR